MDLNKSLVEVLALLGAGCPATVDETDHASALQAAAASLRDVAATIHEPFDASVSRTGTDDIISLLGRLSQEWKRVLVVLVLPDWTRKSGDLVVLEKPSGYPLREAYADSPLWMERAAVVVVVKRKNRERSTYHRVTWVSPSSSRTFLTVADIVDADVFRILGTQPKTTALYKDLGNVIVTLRNRLPPSVRAQFLTSSKRK